MRRAALTLSLAVGGVALGPAAASAASCAPPEAARGVTALLADIDRGEGRAAAARMMLHAPSARSFSYYAVRGVSPAPAGPTAHTVTHRRPLIRYLARRHTAGERVRLLAVRMEYRAEGRTGLSVVLARSAPDLGTGREYLVGAKADWSCRRNALIKLAGGIVLPLQDWADPSRVCAGSGLRRETSDGVVVCARKRDWPQ